MRAARSLKREARRRRKPARRCSSSPTAHKPARLAAVASKPSATPTLAGLAEGVGHASLHTFLLDNDYGWDDGLICGGRMTVLADPVEPTDAGYFQRLRELAESGAGFTEVVALANNSAGEPPASRHLFTADGDLIASRPTPPLDVATLTDALTLDALGRPRLGVRSGLAVLPDYPRVRLLIVGAVTLGRRSRSSRLIAISRCGCSMIANRS